MVPSSHRLYFPKKAAGKLIIDEQMGIVLRDFSHDLVAPIRRINDTLTDLKLTLVSLEHHEITSAIDECVLRIRNETKRLQSVVKANEDLLSLGTERPVPVLVPELIRSILESLVPPPETEIEIIEIRRNVTVTALVDLLTVIVKNIIKNAIEAMPSGGKLTIKIATVGGEKRTLIDVIDTGTGIPVEVRDKIFDFKFTYGKEKGRGIGLFLATRAANAIGADIRIEDAPEGGTMVSIEIPRGDKNE